MTPEDIDRILGKLGKIWKRHPDQGLNGILFTGHPKGILGRYYGATREDRWISGHMTNAEFEQCLDAIIQECEAFDAST